MTQAEPVYQTIVGPGNALADVVARGSSGPYAQFRTDMLAYASELRSEIGEFSKVQWPASVRPHITTMIRQDFPADIGCLRAQAAAGGAKAAQQVANTSHDCMIADNATIPQLAARDGDRRQLTVRYGSSAPRLGRGALLRQ